MEVCIAFNCLQIESVQPAEGGITVVVITDSDCRSEFLTDWALPVYVTWVTLSIYVIPIIALISVYSHICLAVWRSERFKRTVSRTPQQSVASNRRSCSVNQRGRGERTHGGGPQTSTTVSTAKLKTVKLTMVVVLSYVVCYGPFFVVQMWAAWDEHAPFEGMYV